MGGSNFSNGDSISNTFRGSALNRKKDKRPRAMLQLHLSDQQFYCSQRCAYTRGLTVLVYWTWKHFAIQPTLPYNGNAAIPVTAKGLTKYCMLVMNISCRTEMYRKKTCIVPCHIWGTQLFHITNRQKPLFDNNDTMIMMPFTQTNPMIFTRNTV